jgi:uncharacterized protein DUF3667
MSEPGDSPNCLNCGAALAGQYCGRCGQRATSRLISIIELLRDAFGDLFELDSRLWRTVLPFLIRPGLLTIDYLEGRRARYMPPFRMYLVLSLVFFVVAFFDPRNELAVFYEPVPEPVVETSADEAMPDDGGGNDGLKLTIDDAETDDIVVTFNDDGMLGDCTVGSFDTSDSPAWLQRRMTPERLEGVCKRLQNAGLTGLTDAITGNIPAALIILLPLMAFVLKLLYPLSRRYYVEHLLFFVHFHAFFFLILTLQVLLARLGAWIGFAETIFTLIIVAASLYVPAYLFVAMRRVYGQRRATTFLKYVPLTISYLVGFTFVMLGATIIAVFSI